MRTRVLFVCERRRLKSEEDELRVVEREGEGLRPSRSVLPKSRGP